MPPLPPDEVADYVALRFAASDRAIGSALDALLEASQGHPQRTMLLAHLLWEFTEPGEEATEEIWLSAYDEAMHHVRDELRATWSALPASQRRVLTAIAENREGIYAAGRRQGGSRGGAVRAALDSLRDRGDVVEDAATTSGWRLVDPLLATWVNEGRPGA